MKKLYLVVRLDPYDHEDRRHPEAVFDTEEDAQAFRVTQYEKLFGEGTANQDYLPGWKDIDRYFEISPIKYFPSESEEA